MTLVLTYMRSNYVLQVSDRLVTIGGKQFDEAANKSLIVLLDDAIVCVSYTGHAYIGGDKVSTDQWLAELLSGTQIDAQVLSRPPIRLSTGPIEWWPRMGIALTALRLGLDDAYQRLPRGEQKFAPSVVLAGWKNVGHRSARKAAGVRPVIALVAFSGNAGRYVIQQQDRWWHLVTSGPATNSFFVANLPGFVPSAGSADAAGQPEVSQSAIPTRSSNFRLIEVPRTLSPQTLALTMNLLRDAASPDAAEQILVQTIRQVAKESTTVGEDCMSMHLLPPGGDLAIVRFLPKTRWTHTFARGSHDFHDLPAAYTPWLVGPQIRWPPTILAGASSGVLFDQMLGQYTVRFEYPGIEPDFSATRAFVIDPQTRRPRR